MDTATPVVSFGIHTIGRNLVFQVHHTDERFISTGEDDRKQYTASNGVVIKSKRAPELDLDGDEITVYLFWDVPEVNERASSEFCKNESVAEAVKQKVVDALAEFALNFEKIVNPKYIALPESVRIDGQTNFQF